MDNVLTARRVARNTIIQVVGRAIGLLIVLVTINYIANHLVVDGSALKGFGQYTIVFAYASIIGAAADLGLFTLAVREITGKSATEAGRIIGSALGFRLMLMIGSLGLFGLLYPFLPYEPAVNQGILIGVVVAFSMLFSQVISSIFQANLVTERIVISELLGKAAIALLTIYVLKQGWGLIEVVWANLAGQLITLAVGYALARPLVIIPIGFDFSILRQAGPQFWSLALITVLGLVHFKLDSLLLSFFRPASEVGIYGLAYKLLEIILIIPSIFAANLLPVMTTIIDQGALERLMTVIRRSMTALIATAAAITLAVFALAPLVIVYVGQLEFVEAGLPLRILLVAGLFVFISTLMVQVAVSGRLQQGLVKGYLVLVGLNLALNLYAIPRYSYLGAASVTVITEGMLLLYTAWFVSRHFGSGWSIATMSRIAGAAALTAVVAAWFDQNLRLSPAAFDELGKLAQTGYLALSVGWIIGLFLLLIWLFWGARPLRLKGLRELI